MYAPLKLCKIRNWFFSIFDFSNINLQRSWFKNRKIKAWQNNLEKMVFFTHFSKFKPPPGFALARS